MAQKTKGASKPLPDGKVQEERDKEEINLVSALNPGDRGSEAGGASSPSRLWGTAPEVQTAKPTAPPLQDAEWASHP